MKCEGIQMEKTRILADIEKGEHGSTDAARTLTSQNIAAETIAPNRVEHNLNPCKIVDYISPRGPQIDALYELKKTRFEGFGKGLVVAATGAGVIIVTGCINALVSRISGTLIKNDKLIYAK